jgi:transcriptional regulator with XRE-family HTH domain
VLESALMEATPAQRFREALTALSHITDPAERAIQGHELQEATKASAAHLRVIVGDSVAELRSQMGLAQIAELLGVSVQRISQIATGKHGTARPRPSLIYAFRVIGDQPGRWYGQPGALPEGSYQTGTIDFNPGTNPSPYAGSTLEVRYGPAPDDGLPAYLQGYTTVNGLRIRPTALVQEELFRDPGIPARASARSAG